LLVGVLRHFVSRVRAHALSRPSRSRCHRQCRARPLPTSAVSSFGDVRPGSACAVTTSSRANCWGIPRAPGWHLSCLARCRSPRYWRS